MKRHLARLLRQLANRLDPRAAPLDFGVALARPSANPLDELLATLTPPTRGAVEWGPIDRTAAFDDELDRWLERYDVAVDQAASIEPDRSSEFYEQIRRRSVEVYHPGEAGRNYYYEEVQAARRRRAAVEASDRKRYDEEEARLWLKSYDASRRRHPPPEPHGSAHGFTPPGYAPCTREPGHEGPCAHDLAAP